MLSATLSRPWKKICFHYSKCIHKYKHTLALHFLLKYSQKLESKEHSLGCTNLHPLKIDCLQPLCLLLCFIKAEMNVGYEEFQ